MELEINNKIRDQLEKLIQQIGEKIVGKLSEEYNFSFEQGMKLLNLKVKKEEIKKAKTIKSKIVLPFCGVKFEDKCEAVRLNHSLYTQCLNDGDNNKNGRLLCNTCKKQSDKNSNGEPTYGYIDERIRKGNDFRDPKGKLPVLYGNIMEKLGISREEAIKEAKLIGITIPENEFEIKRAQRGRPKKDTSAIDTSESEEEERINKNPKKNPGRPKKDKSVINSLNFNKEEKNNKINKQDNFGNKFQDTKIISKEIYEYSSDELELEKELEQELEQELEESKEKVELDEEDEEEDDDEDEKNEVAVIIFEINGKKYLKAADNTLYDIDTHEEIGNWNENLKEINFS